MTAAMLVQSGPLLLLRVLTVSVSSAWLPVCRRVPVQPAGLPHRHRQDRRHHHRNHHRHRKPPPQPPPPSSRPILTSSACLPGRHAPLGVDLGPDGGQGQPLLQARSIRHGRRVLTHQHQHYLSPRSSPAAAAPAVPIIVPLMTMQTAVVAAGDGPHGQLHCSMGPHHRGLVRRRLTVLCRPHGARQDRDRVRGEDWQR